MNDKLGIILAIAFCSLVAAQNASTTLAYHSATPLPTTHERPLISDPFELIDENPSTTTTTTPPTATLTTETSIPTLNVPPVSAPISSAKPFFVTPTAPSPTPTLMTGTVFSVPTETISSGESDSIDSQISAAHSTVPFMLLGALVANILILM